VTGTLSALRTITQSGITHSGITRSGHTNPREFLPTFLLTYSPVISTEAAHGLIVGRAVEKSASLPEPSTPPPRSRYRSTLPGHPVGRQKNILQKRGKSSPSKKCRPGTTIYHAIHHNFTTIYHHETPQNRQNPLQKRLSTRKTFFP
jgi:hypothetical protein